MPISKETRKEVSFEGVLNAWTEMVKLNDKGLESGDVEVSDLLSVFVCQQLAALATTVCDIADRNENIILTMAAAARNEGERDRLMDVLVTRIEQLEARLASH